MMGNYTGNWLYTGWHLHIILGGALIVGAILFIIWAAKALKPKELLTWAVILMVIGALGVFLTAGTGFRGMRVMMGGNWDKDDAQVEDMVEEMNEIMGIEE